MQITSIFNKKGYNLLEDEWDYAIILDACRYDVAKKIGILNYKVEKKQSPASATMEWVRNCITDEQKDKILVSANPYLSNEKILDLAKIKNPFFKNIALWKYGWDEELGTIPPWAMAKRGKKIARKNPKKRILFWFIQPHHPFIGYTTKIKLNDKIKRENKEDEIFNVWQAFANNLVKKKEVWAAYEKNLKIAINFGVKELIDSLSGKIIITSDHGNAFGEMGIYSHPQRVHLKELIEVPFIKIEKK